MTENTVPGDIYDYPNRSYSRVEGKSAGQLGAELRKVFDNYQEYRDPDLGAGTFSAMVARFAGDAFYNLHYVARRFCDLVEPEVQAWIGSHHDAEYAAYGAYAVAPANQQEAWEAAYIDAYGQRVTDATEIAGATANQEASAAPVAFAVGVRVTAKGYAGEWVVAEVLLEPGEDVSDARVHLRSIDRENATVLSGHFGSTLLAQRDRYTWMTVPCADLSLAPSAEPVPGVVTGLTRSADSYGPYKKALVAGERFPESALHDPPWAVFIATLHERGYVVPTAVRVVCAISSETMAHGVYTVEQVLEDDVLQAARAEERGGEPSPRA